MQSELAVEVSKSLSNIEFVKLGATVCGCYMVDATSTKLQRGRGDAALFYLAG
jgi:hypothetical protein